MIEKPKSILINPSVSRKKTSFAGDVLTLVGGTTFAQILSILAAPVLSRLYGPEDFGLSALFVSITGIFSVIICLRYERTIMLPESDEEAVNLLILSLGIALIFSILTIPFTWLAGKPLQDVLNAPKLSSYLWLAPPFIFLSGVFLALNFWNTRTKHLWRLSKARITRSIAGTGTQLGAGLAGYATGGSLIGAYCVGQLVSSLVLSIQIWKEDKSLIQKNVSTQKIIRGLKRYREFPLISTWSALLNTISWQLPSLLFASFFSTTIVGFYSFGFSLLQLPMSFIGGSISQVFFQRAVETKSEGKLAELVENIFRLLLIIGMFPILILTFVGREIFIVFFGSNWAEAGVYAQILSIWSLVWFISSPLDTLIDVMEKQKFGFRYNFTIFATRFLSIVIGGIFKNIYLALVLYSISGILAYGLPCLKLMSYSGVDLSHIKKIIISNFLKFTPAGIILIFLKFADKNPFIIVFTSVFLCIIYYLYLLKADSQLNILLKQFKIGKDIKIK